MKNKLTPTLVNNTGSPEAWGTLSWDAGGGFGDVWLDLVRYWQSGSGFVSFGSSRIVEYALVGGGFTKILTLVYSIFPIIILDITSVVMSLIESLFIS